LHMQTYKIFMLLALLAMIALFTFQNMASVEVRFLFWSAVMPSGLLLLAALMVGVVLGVLLSFLNVRRRAKKAALDAQQHVL